MTERQPQPRTRFIELMQQRFSAMHYELTGLGLVVAALITLLSLLSISSGVISDGWANWLRQVFGWGALPLAIGTSCTGILLLLGKLRDESAALEDGSEAPLRWDLVVAAELLFVAGLTGLHLLVGGDDPLKLAQAGDGGGLIGWGISTLLVDGVGKFPAAGLVLGLVLAALGLLLRTSAGDPSGRLRPSRPIPPDKEELARYQGQPDELDEEAPAPTAARPAARRRTSKSRLTAEIAAVPLHAQAGEAGRPGPRSQHLPPLDLLVASSKDTAGAADVRYQAQVIEETLQGFGIPVRVKEINVGPTITQYGIEPGYVMRPGPDGTPQRQRVRVGRISALVNDLALALSAAPIRIEAPVPGRSVVGIEVPNSKVSLVSLRGVLESDVYRRTKGPLRVPLGRDVSGTAVVADLARMPHLLIAGATGSGKSVCVNAIITGLLCDHPPDELKLLMVDPKMVELIGYNGVPHLLAPVIVDLEEVPPALTWVTRVMEERFQLFSRASVRNIHDYNQKAARHRGQELLQHIVVIIDELADLMMMAPDEIERCVTRIAQMARATGIHMVIATQRPSVDVVTGLIKANFPARIAFAVTSQIDSRVILDVPGAERLLGRGDCLLMLPDSRLRRLQGCFVSDPEIRRVVDFWKETTGEVPVTASCPWEGILAEPDQDAMLEEAIDLVMKSGRASTSFLQRRLGIGYPRAARLMDQLEEEGIVGQAEGSNVRRVLAGSSAEYDEADAAGEPLA